MNSSTCWTNTLFFFLHYPNMRTARYLINLNVHVRLAWAHQIVTFYFMRGSFMRTNIVTKKATLTNPPFGFK